MNDDATKESFADTGGERLHPVDYLHRDEARPEQQPMMTTPLTSPDQGWNGERRAAQATDSRQTAAIIPDGSESAHRRTMFERLVTDEGDVAGLLAYSLYKLGKREWLSAFATANDRAPSADETRAFMLVEQSARRVASYRREAEGRLAGFVSKSGPAMPDGKPAPQPRMEMILQDFARGANAEALRTPALASESVPLATVAKPQVRTMAGYLLLLLALVGVLALLVNYAKSSFLAP